MEVKGGGKEGSKAGSKGDTSLKQDIKKGSEKPLLSDEQHAQEELLLGAEKRVVETKKVRAGLWEERLGLQTREMEATIQARNLNTRGKILKEQLKLVVALEADSKRTLESLQGELSEVDARVKGADEAVEGMPERFEVGVTAASRGDAHHHVTRRG